MTFTIRNDTPRRPLVRLCEGVVRKSAQVLTKASLLPFKTSDEHLVRYSMYQQISEAVSNIHWEDCVNGLSISGSYKLAHLACKHVNVVDASYPDHNVLDLQFEDNSFDLVVSDQVLEHVEGDPFKAVSETCRVLKPGGIAVHASVLLYQIHGYPSDFWRFTPDALALLCSEFSSIVATGGWGNRYVPILNWLGLIDGFRVPLNSWHPYNYFATANEWRYPVVTWVVAVK